MARSAHREAVEYFEQALSTLPHLPAQHDTRQQAMDLRLALGSALQPWSDWGRMLAYLREAEALAEDLDDPRRLGQVAVRLSRHFYFTGAHDQSIAAGQRALALATADGDVILQALANLRLGMEPGACVIEIHLPLRVEPAVLRRPQRVERRRRFVVGMGLQEIGVGGATHRFIIVWHKLTRFPALTIMARLTRTTSTPCSQRESECQESLPSLRCSSSFQATCYHRLPRSPTSCRRCCR